MKSKVSSIQAYIAAAAPETRKKLRELRALVKATAPRVTERISYGIPTFDLNGRYLVYIAAFKEHVSIYPAIGAAARELKKELAPYRAGKGTLRFPLDRPLPRGLIRKFVRVRVTEHTARAR
jgi:uncharacterized protein YdhG (YjbR/CyaY superfamily)